MAFCGHTKSKPHSPATISSKSNVVSSFNHGVGFQVHHIAIRKASFRCWELKSFHHFRYRHYSHSECRANKDNAEDFGIFGPTCCHYYYY